MRLPGENSMQRIILDHMSRDIWLDIPLLYNMLWQLGTMPSLEQFNVSVSQLMRDGFLERRRAYIGNSQAYTRKFQYRLTEYVAFHLPKQKRRGRHMGTKPAANCNWFLTPNQRLRSVL